MPRIVGGEAKGRRLKTPKGDVRPATARARTALFDYLSQIIPGSNVLDLYCGSGGLGIEALSRGANACLFVDLSPKVITVTRDNVRMCGYWEKAAFEIRDVFRFLHNRPEVTIGAFDVILAAPPYKIAEPIRLLDAIDSSGILADGGIVCMEYSRHTPAPNPSFFTLARRRIYGETVIEVWDKGGSETGQSQEITEDQEIETITEGSDL